MPKTLVRLASLAVPALAAFAAVAEDAPFTAAFARMEIHSLPTVTLSTRQFLTGNIAGKPAVLAGELRIPKPGTDRLPAVILIHGSGGLSASPDRWAQELNSIGVATFILDTFSGRGIVSTINDQSQLDSLGMMIDAYRALALLASHPRIDPMRIAVWDSRRGRSRRSIRAIGGFARPLDPRQPNSRRTSGSIRLATSPIATTTR